MVIRARLSLRSGAASPHIVAIALLLGATVLLTVCALAPLAALHALIVPVALVAPGYAMIVAAFDPGARFDVVPTLALSILLSLAGYALLALVLATVSIPLSRGSVLAGVDAMLLLLLIPAFLGTRRPGVPGARRAPLDLRMLTRTSLLRRVALDGEPERTRASRSGNTWIAGYTLAAALSLAILFVLVRTLPQPIDPPYSSISLSGSWSHISNIVDLHGRGGLSVMVRVANETHRPQRYQLTPQLDTTGRWPSLAVPVHADRTWDGMVHVVVPADGCLHRLSIDLRIAGNRTVLGRLVIWVRAAAGTRAACKATHG